MRIDDIDPPRCVPGSDERVLEALRAHGFPDVPTRPLYQSDHLGRHLRALDELCARGALFECGCTRRELGPHGGCVRGCRRASLAPAALAARLERIRPCPPMSRAPRVPAPGATSVRLRLTGALAFDDRVQGTRCVDFDTEGGDAVLLRRDDVVAYHLATAVDDAGYDDVVRGADLLSSTAVQIALQRRLGLASPRYAHVPVACDADGAKLGKSTHAAPLEPGEAAASLRRAWRFLGQTPLDGPPTVAAFWDRAPSAWRLADVPRAASLAWARGVA